MTFRQPRIPLWEARVNHHILDELDHFLERSTHSPSVIHARRVSITLRHTTPTAIFEWEVRDPADMDLLMLDLPGNAEQGIEAGRGDLGAESAVRGMNRPGRTTAAVLALITLALTLLALSSRSCPICPAPITPTQLTCGNCGYDFRPWWWRRKG